MEVEGGEQERDLAGKKKKELEGALERLFFGDTYRG